MADKIPNRISADEWRKRVAVNKSKSYRGRGPESILQEACVTYAPTADHIGNYNYSKTAELIR